MSLLQRFAGRVRPQLEWDGEFYLLLAGQVLNDGPCLWRLLGCGVVDKNLGGDPQRSQQ